MNLSEITIKTISIISLKTQIRPYDLSEDTTLQSMDLDSLDMMELEMDFEEEFGIELDITRLFYPATIKEIAFQINVELNG